MSPGTVPFLSIHPCLTGTIKLKSGWPGRSIEFTDALEHVKGEQEAWWAQTLCGVRSLLLLYLPHQLSLKWVPIIYSGSPMSMSQESPRNHHPVPLLASLIFLD